MAAKDKGFYSKKTLNLNGKIIDLNTPAIMGILNLTPDSFYDGGRLEREDQIFGQCEKFLKDGVDIIDLGGYSTRPGAKEISSEEEWQRLIPALDIILENFPEIPISVDTFRSDIAQRSVLHGASMINDVSGGTLDPKMYDTISELQVPYVLMHMKGTPQTMQSRTQYDNVIQEVLAELEKKLFNLTNRGLNDVILDVGFGFAKTLDHNYELLKRLEAFKIFDVPLLAGISRKSMIWKTLNITPEEALNGSTALHMAALKKGASILRVHDVKEAKQVVYLNNSLTK